MVKAIVGGNWGDEGKGKITDFLAEDADIVVRFQGGANAGHTIINEYGRFALHILPSGVFRQKVANVIAQGVALDLGKLLSESPTASPRRSCMFPTGRSWFFRIMCFLTNWKRLVLERTATVRPNPESLRFILINI